jgi:hypothetical protein
MSKKNFPRHFVPWIILSIDAVVVILVIGGLLITQ